MKTWKMKLLGPQKTSFFLSVCQPDDQCARWNMASVMGIPQNQSLCTPLAKIFFVWILETVWDWAISKAVNILRLHDSLPSQTLSEASGHPAGGLMINTSLCWGWARKMCYLKRTYLQTILPQLFNVRQRSPIHLFRFLICLSIHLSFFSVIYKLRAKQQRADSARKHSGRDFSTLYLVVLLWVLYCWFFKRTPTSWIQLPLASREKWLRYRPQISKGQPNFLKSNTHVSTCVCTHTQRRIDRGFSFLASFSFYWPPRTF